MNTKLFAVKLQNFKSYYAIASDYNEAVSKVEEYLKTIEQPQNVLTPDGSLANTQYDNPIRHVELLTENLII